MRYPPVASPHPPCGAHTHARENTAFTTLSTGYVYTHEGGRTPTTPSSGVHSFSSWTTGNDAPSGASCAFICGGPPHAPSTPRSSVGFGHAARAKSNPARASPTRSRAQGSAKARRHRAHTRLRGAHDDPATSWKSYYNSTFRGRRDERAPSRARLVV
eukprot:994245-Prorocentrum_minimum.AAC.1